MSKKRQSLSEMLVENSFCSRKTLKRKLIKEGLKKEQCEVCGQQNQWNSKPLRMILEHINGISNDNRLENLRFICPNCYY